MSDVTDIIIVCEGIEDGTDELGGGLPALYEWCAAQDRPLRVYPLDLSGTSSGKTPGVNVLATARRGGYDDDDLAAAFPTFPWLFPGSAVLMIQREDALAEIVRGDGARISR